MGNRHGPRQEPLPKVLLAPLVRAYDRTVEENVVIVDTEVKRQFAPKKPEAKQTFKPEAVKWAKDFVEQPSQFEINKADDYLRCMRKVSSRPKKNSSASGKRDVAQLGQQAKQLISPLKVLPTNQGLAADRKSVV